MNKKQKIVLIILSAVLVISAVFAGLCFNEKFLGKITGSIDVTDGASFSDIKKTEFQTDYPLVQSEKPGLFYEIYPDGTVKFYDYNDGEFTENTGAQKKTVNLTCSYQSVSVDVYYLKTDVGTVGYGVYTSQQKSDTKLFSYVFVRLIDCPEAYSKYAKTSYLIFTDMDAEDAYKTNKTYSDIYTCNLENGKTTLVISQRDRLVQSDGTMDEGWTIYTDVQLNSMNKCELFASDRVYDDRDSEPTYDFMTVSNSNSMNKSSAATVVGSPCPTVIEKDTDYYCLINTDTGFILSKNGDKKNPLASFDGSFDNYIVCGKWLLDRANMNFVDFTSGEQISVKKANFKDCSGFIANSDGDKFAVFCPGEKQSVIMYDTSAGTEKIVSGSDIYNSGICNFSFIDGDTFIVTNYDSEQKAINQICRFE